MLVELPLLLLLSPVLHGQKVDAPARLTKMPANQASVLQQKLESESLDGASVHVEGAFVLRAPNTPDLGMVPVLLWPGNDPGNPAACGVIFPSQPSNHRYLQIVTPTATHTDMCTGLSAMALLSGAGPHPSLIALFTATAGHGPDYTLPYILHWDITTDSYVVDGTTSTWLVAHRGSDTIAGVRSLLAHRH